MALEIDGFAILRTIGVHPHLFKAVITDTGKAARTLVTKQITHKTITLKTVRDIRAAIGPDSFSLIVDGLTDAQVKSLATKLDKHAASQKIADGTARRHIVALADGSAQLGEPTPRAPKKAPSKKTATAPGEPKRLHYASAGATRKR